MKAIRSCALIPGASDRGHRSAGPRASDLILAITFVVVLAAGCLLLIAAIA